MIILLIWLVVLVAIVILYLRQVYSTFDRYGVKHVSPLPAVGNMGQVLLRRKHFAKDIQDLYNTFPEERFVGRFEFVNEMVMIRDLDLLKNITVKDFEYFIDHRTVFSEGDPFFGRNLFSLRGEEWKDMRSTLSPAFTSSKMRLMVPFMVEVGDHMIQAIKKKIDATTNGYVDIDCKDLTTRYANDVIASCAFGLKVDSHTDENNDFYANGKLASNFNFRQMLIFFCITNFPKIMKYLNVSLFAESSKAFFKNLVLSTMKDRELRHIIRPDMINILMEVKKGKLTHEAKSEPNTDAGFATVEESSVGKKEIKTGSRFALCEVKVMTYQILQHMVISPCEKTCIPAELSTETFNIRLKGGHWLRFRVRQ